MRTGLSRARLFMTVDAVGGVWTYATDLARGLRERGFDTVMAVVGPPPSPSQRARAETIDGLRLIATGLELDWTAADPDAVRRSADALAALARSEGADLAQVNSAPLGCSDGWRIPVLTVAHSDVGTWWRAVREGPCPQDFDWRVAMTGEAYARADARSAPTRAFAEATADVYPGAGRLSVVRNGRRPARLVRPEAKGRAGAWVFTAGRLWDPGKNAALIDKVAPRLEAPVTAVGPLVAPHGETARFDNLFTPGPVSAARVAEALASRPVFVSPALYEPFGLAVLEAAQAGCPLVLSDIPTFRELWSGAALFVDPRDPEALTAAIRSVLRNGEFAEALSEAARRQARRYDAAAMAAGAATLLNGLLEPPSARSRAPLVRATAEIVPVESLA